MSGNLSSSREIFSHVARALSFSRAIPSPIARSFAAIDLRDQLDAAAAHGLRRLPHASEPQQDDGVAVQERHGEDAAIGSPSLALLQEKEAAMDLFVPARRKKVVREERRRPAGERKESRISLTGNYRDVGGTGTTRSPRFSGYQNYQAIVPMQKCQVWSIKCQICQNA